MPKPLKTGVSSKLTEKSLKRMKPVKPLWKGPMNDGPNGGCTQSLLSAFLCCRERFRIKYVIGLQPEWGFSKVLEFGNCWHLCEEHFAAGDDWLKPLTTYCKELCSRYKLQQEDIEKWFNVIKRMFPVYCDHWKKHPDVKKRTPLMQEEVFHVPYTLPSGRVVWLKGKFDSVDLIDAHSSDGFKYPKGIWLQEDKTKGDIDEQDILQRLSFDIQTMLYLIALQLMGEENGDWGIEGCKIVGVRYNVIRRPFSGGRGSIKLKEGKETKEEFYERFMTDYVNAEPEYWFSRWKSTVSQADIEQFKQEFLNPILEELCDWYDWVVAAQTNGISPFDEGARVGWSKGMTAHHYRLPFGTYNSIMETGGSDLDNYLRTGNTVGLVQVDSLFGELK